MDKRTPRDGRVIEELGYYDPMVPETDARAVLKADRIDYWLSVGAKPSDRVATLIKKYGTSGTHLEAQKAAVERLNNSRRQPPANPRSPKSRKPAVPAKEATAAE